MNLVDLFPDPDVAEAQATSQLEHPGIPPVHDIGVDQSVEKFMAALADALPGASPTALHWAYHFAIGTLIRVELENPANPTTPIEAELTREQYEELNLQEGENVIVRTKNIRLFPKIDYLANRISV